MGYGLRMGFDVPPHLWGGYASHLYLHPRTRLHRAPDDIPTDVLSLFNPLSNAVRWAGERPQTRAGDTVVITGSRPTRPALGGWWRARSARSR